VRECERKREKVRKERKSERAKEWKKRENE